MAILLCAACIRLMLNQSYCRSCGPRKRAQSNGIGRVLGLVIIRTHTQTHTARTSSAYNLPSRLLSLMQIITNPSTITCALFCSPQLNICDLMPLYFISVSEFQRRQFRQTVERFKAPAARQYHQSASSPCLEGSLHPVRGWPRYSCFEHVSQTGE